MKKLYQLFLIATATLLAGCSTSQTGVYVGNFSNSECLNKTRAPYSNTCKLKLTRSGNDIIGELLNYEANCWHGNLSIECQQQGSRLNIYVRETFSEEPATIATCVCPINIYFTIYDVEGEEFQVYLDDDHSLNENYLGVASFKEHSIVQFDTFTHDIAYEEGFEYTPILQTFGVYETDYLDPDGYNDTVLRLGWDTSFIIGGGYNNFYLPCDAQKVEGKLEIDDDGTLILSPLVDGKTIDGKPSGNCIRRASINFQIYNALKDSYHVKVNPHEVIVKNVDGTEHVETVCDFEGDLKRGVPVEVNP